MDDVGSRLVKKDFVAIDVGLEQIDLRKWGHIGVFKPIELYYKRDGSIKDEPSLCIVMQRVIPETCCTAVGEISLEMLNNGLADIGLKLVRESDLGEMADTIKVLNTAGEQLGVVIDEIRRITGMKDPSGAELIQHIKELVRAKEAKDTDS